MLCSSVLASFADAKLLDFSPSNSSKTLRIKETLRAHKVYAIYSIILSRLSICIRDVVVTLTIVCVYWLSLQIGTCRLATFELRFCLLLYTICVLALSE